MTSASQSSIGTAADRPLTRAEAEVAFETLFNGEATPSQIGGFLMALRTRGETVDEFAAAAAIMRAKCNAVRAPQGAMDIVGTGGDGKGTLNISTATAFVVAGAGVPVAKHGNRNLSSKSGAADALGQMGTNVMVGVDVVERALEEIGIAFLNPEAIEILRKSGGCYIDGEIVRMGRDFVMEKIALAPSQFDITPRNPDRKITVGGKHLLFGNVSSPPN